MSEGLQDRSIPPLMTAWSSRISSLKAWTEQRLEFVVMAIAFTIMTIAYVIVFQIARDETVLTSMSAGVRNIGAVLPIAFFVRYCIRGPIRRCSFAAKLVAHIALACFVSLAWYTLVLFLRNWSIEWMQSGVSFRPFSEKASFWHLYQGLVVYAALVSAFYAFLLRSQLEDFKQNSGASSLNSRPRLGGVFVKSDDEFIRLEHGDVTHISANNETVMIHTRQRSFRSQKTLKDLEKDLQAFGFIRIHRSNLVNLAMVRSAEPTGDGRLTLHMANNTSLVSSRAGAKRFKEIVQT